MTYFKKILGLATFYFCLLNNPFKVYAGEGALVYDVASDNAVYGQAISNNSGANTPRFGNNITITTYGSGDGAGIGQNTGIYSNFAGDIIVGNHLTITTSGEHADGIRTNPSGMSDWKNSNSVITIGDNLKITTNGKNADGINANGISTVIIGDNATITTTNTEAAVQGAYAIRANFGSSIVIGNNLTASTAGDSSHAVYTALGLGSGNTGGANITIGDNSFLSTSGKSSHAISVASKNGFVNLGNNSTISTSGNSSHGVYVGAITSSVILGDYTSITTKGDASHGVYSLSKDASITIGKNSNISTEGKNSHGIFLNNKDASVNLEGNLSIKTTDENSNAIFISSGRLDDSKQEEVATKAVPSYNSYNIEGNLKTATNGYLNLNFGNGSIFKGTANKDTGSINLSFYANSHWYATNSWNADISLNQDSHLYLGNIGTINSSAFVADGKFEINGATIHFDSNIVNQTGDILEITEQVTGSGGKISVQNQGSANTDGTEIISLIDAKQGGSDFELLNDIELGGYAYSLDSINQVDGSTLWFLKSTRLTPTSKGAINVFSGNYLLNYAEISTLIKRMGELHNDLGKGGIWARTFTGKIKSNVHYELGNYKMSYSGLEFGNDKVISQNKKGDKTFLGWMAGNTEGKLSYDSGSGKIKSRSVGAYFSYIKKDSFYFDVISKYNFVKDTFSTIDSQKDLVKGSANTTGISFSVELGKSYSLNKRGLYITPQTQFITGHQKGSKFHATNGLNVDIGGYNYLLNRTGFNIGYSTQNKNPLNIYMKANYLKEFGNKTSYYLNDSKKDVSFNDSKFNIGFGITTQISKKHNFYFDIERTLGKKFNQPYSLNLGYRMSI